MLDKTKCVGCTDNFYNGNNPFNIQECWSLKSAQLVQRIRIGVWQSPPYDPTSTIEVYHCRKEKGNCLIKPEALTKDGYWR